MSAARYTINTQLFEFVAVSPVYWTLKRVSDGTIWRAYGDEIRPRMLLERERVTP
jgi:hypothetical protein